MSDILILCVDSALHFVVEPCRPPSFMWLVHASSPEEFSSLQEYSWVTVLMMVAGSRGFRDESHGLCNDSWNDSKGRFTNKWAWHRINTVIVGCIRYAAKHMVAFCLAKFQWKLKGGSFSFFFFKLGRWEDLPKLVGEAFLNMENMSEGLEISEKEQTPLSRLEGGEAGKVNQGHFPRVSNATLRRVCLIR